MSPGEPFIPRILLIDDNRSIHEDFRKILRPEMDSIGQAEAAFFGGTPGPVDEPDWPEFEIESAYQGEEGVEMALKADEAGRPFALAFVDVRMPPGIDGVETAERLWLVAQDMEVVLCTAYSDYAWPDLNRRLRHRERLLILKKPFSSIEVLQMASGLTRKWQLAQEAKRLLSESARQVRARTDELRESNRRLVEEMEQRRSAEQHLLRSQRLESVGTLASGMAHDLNNTISPILMAAQMLREEPPGELHEQMVETIEASAERAAGIVRQVLTFARGVEGERTLLLPKFLVSEIEKIARGTFPRSISVNMRLAENLPLISGDSTLLHQVLMNLSVNARDAMPDGGALLFEADTVDVGLELVRRCPDATERRYVRFRVSDTGTGIPPESLSKIFDPFFTTKELGQGTGLGLSMVAGIVKSHSGFLDVESAVGSGTVFSIYLPSVQCETDPAQAAPAEKGALGGQGQLILVVDDEEAIREAVTALLTRHGYRVLTAADGAEALYIYAREWSRISLMITDLMMPVVDGIELCRALRVMSPELPIVTCSGYADERRTKELQFLNLQAILGKPVRSDVLLGTIRDVLAKVQAAQREDEASLAAAAADL